MALNPILLERLACPQDHGPLLYFEGEHTLYNPRLRRKYDIADDIPNMLIEEASDAAADEHDRLVAKAAVEGILPTFASGESGESDPS